MGVGSPVPAQCIYLLAANLVMWSIHGLKIRGCPVSSYLFLDRPLYEPISDRPDPTGIVRQEIDAIAISRVAMATAVRRGTGRPLEQAEESNDRFLCAIARVMYPDATEKVRAAYVDLLRITALDLLDRDRIWAAIQDASNTIARVLAGGHKMTWKQLLDQVTPSVAAAPNRRIRYTTACIESWAEAGHHQ
jgi:hypothetical protein